MSRRFPGAELVIIPGGRGVERDPRADAPRQVPEGWRRVIEKLEMQADIMAMENPFTHLLPPDEPPPRGAPGQRIVHGCDELPEETEAAERKAAPKLASRGRH